MPATVIVGAQWGDEGKGKIVDLLAQHSDVVCRYQGGPNAGHTIVADGQTYKFRHMPSGILWGKECVLGAGCVVDPAVFIEELDDLEARGLVSSSLGDPTPERGGRAKRYFRVTAKGLREVRATQRSLVRLWQGLPELKGGAA